MILILIYYLNIKPISLFLPISFYNFTLTLTEKVFSIIIEMLVKQTTHNVPKIKQKVIFLNFVIENLKNIPF